MRKQTGRMGLVGLFFLIPSIQAGLYLPGKSELPGRTDLYPLPHKPDLYLKDGFGDRRLFAKCLDAALLDPSARANMKLGEGELKLVEIIEKELQSLSAKRKDKTLSVEEGILLGGYYLLGNQTTAAIEVLTEVHEKDPKNFMILGNLAVAYLNQGLPDRAFNMQEQLLSAAIWPKQVPGWSAARLRWQRRAEVAFFNLLKLRRDEGPPPMGSAVQQPPDNLFPAVRFVGLGEKYVAGGMDLRMQDKLPSDATALVEQMILWLPNDHRLTWLLAELFNAQGDIIQAEFLMNNLSDRGIGGELRVHRRVLAEAVANMPKTELEAPPSLPDTTPSGNKPPPEQPSNTDAGSWLPDWRPLAVGGGAGFVLGMLVLLQLQQLFRRR